MLTPARLPARLARAWPVAAGALLLPALLHPLLDPGVLLVTRDIVTFHLPLRATAVELALLHGVPEWNPLINGGQPILSNPNYAAFYPPTWLGLVLPASVTISLLVLLHAGLAFAGTWRLLRSLDCDPGAAALGAVGFSCSTWFLSLTHTLNFYCGMAWLPWALAAGVRLLARHGGGTASSLVATATVLALQLLAGEPVVVLISGVALACLAGARWRSLRSSASRLAAVALLAALLAAVQLVPTTARLIGSERAGGLSAAQAGEWSTRPARLVDLVLPRFWGHALRDEEGLWFGWEVHDRSFPYVVALYSGLLLTVLAAAAVLSWPIPHRAGWGLAFATGLFLATGQHNPLWAPLHESLPLLQLVRYPEKFLALAAAVVPIAGALGWQHLHDAIRRGVKRTALFPLALAAVVGSVTTLFLAVLHLRPEVGRYFVTSHGSGLQPSPRTMARAVAFLHREATVAWLVATAVVLLLVWMRSGRGARAWMPVALVLVAADLGWYVQGLLPTVSAAQLLAPPPLARQAAALGGRIYSAEVASDEPEIHLRVGPQGHQQLWAGMQRLGPYTGALWSVRYALNTDYDMMLTVWGAHAVRLLEAAWARREWAYRTLGAWEVRLIVMPRRPSEVIAELARTGKMAQEHVVAENPRALPAYRFPREIGRLQRRADALAALQAVGFDLRARDFCIGESAPAAARYAAARVLEVHDGGQVQRLRYRAGGPAFLVIATAYDRGWGAVLADGTELRPCPTALGQIGLPVPGGEHEVVLRYRDPWVRVGAAVTLSTLLAIALVALRRHPARHREPSTAADPPR